MLADRDILRQGRLQDSNRIVQLFSDVRLG